MPNFERNIAIANLGKELLIANSAVWSETLSVYQVVEQCFALAEEYIKYCEQLMGDEE